MIHYNQPITITRNANDLNLATQEKTINVKVVNIMGQVVNTYSISANPSQKIATLLKKQPQVIQVLVNGRPVTGSQLASMKGNEVNDITLMTQAGTSLNLSYTLDGQLNSLSSGNSIITRKGAKIDVPSNILSQGKLTSVAINGVEYTGEIEGNSVVINQPIPVTTTGSYNVVLNLNNNKSANYGPTTKTTAGVTAIVMNQYGQEISTTNFTSANGMDLANIISNVNDPIQSLTYNGNTVTLMQLLTQSYAPGTDNIFVVNVQTPPKLQMYVNFNGRSMFYDNSDSSINSNGAKLQLPSGLVKHFNVSSININGINYKGDLKGDTYTIKSFIPLTQDGSYNVHINFVRR